MAEQKYRENDMPELEDLLGISKRQSKEVREEIVNTIGQEGFVESHRESVMLLNEVETALDQFITSYKKNPEDREPVEKAFAINIGVLQSMARRFHPLSDYGKKMLSRAAESRKEFEALAGSMITRITSDNISLFGTVLSPDIQEDIINGRLHALGALRTSKKTVYGVGAVVYHVDSLFIDTGEVLRVDWLYVNKKFRERGVANHLIGELIWRMSEVGITEMSVEIPANITDMKLVSYIFSSWQFSMDAQISPDTVIRVGDIDVSKLEKTGNKKAGNKTVGSLSYFDNAVCKMLVKKALRCFVYSGYLWNVPEDYLDKDLSFYVGSGTNTDIMLLTHRMPSGLIRVECPGATPEGEKYLQDLLSAFLKKVVKTEADDALVLITADAEEIGEIMNAVCPGQMGQYLIAGTLRMPPEGLNLNSDDIEKLLSETARN